MGISYLDQRYTINGLVDTSSTVHENLEKLCNAAGSWLTYDTHAGKWAVVINKAGSAQYSFDDSNIIGPINVITTAIDQLYNSVKVSYPHEDLKGQLDFVQISIPLAERFPTEFENVLELNYGVVTNPVQAELLGFIELKQNRVDKIIQFKTDYSKISVKAGDLIEVTNDVYSFVNKMFRVVTVSESEGDAGEIDINITALEYDSAVYEEDLHRYIRTDSNGIIPLTSLAPPAKPTVIKTEISARPRISATTTIPGGLVESIEFWFSTDVGLSDAAREYALLKVATPITSGFTGNVMPIATPVSIEADNLSTSNFVIKARSVNKDGVSVFSEPSDVANFSPVQVTNAIGPATDVIDGSGSSLLGLTGANVLMSLLKGLMDDSNSSPGGLFGKIFDVFKDKTGVDIVEQAQSGSIGGVILKDEGTALGTASTINFVGAGVTATNTTGDATVTISGVTGPAGPSVIVRDEGNTLTTATESINFVGDGVTATTSGNNVTVAIPVIAGPPGATGATGATGTFFDQSASTPTLWHTGNFQQLFGSSQFQGAYDSRIGVYTSKFLMVGNGLGVSGGGVTSVAAGTRTFRVFASMLAPSSDYTFAPKQLVITSKSGEVVYFSKQATSNPRYTSPTTTITSSIKIYYATCQTYNPGLALQSQTWSTWTLLKSDSGRALGTPTGTPTTTVSCGTSIYSGILASSPRRVPACESSDVLIDTTFTVSLNVPIDGIVAIGVSHADIPTGTPVENNTVLNTTGTSLVFPGYTPISGQTASIQTMLVKQDEPLFYTPAALSVGMVWPTNFQTAADSTVYGSGSGLHTSNDGSAKAYATPLPPRLLSAGVKIFVT